MRALRIGTRASALARWQAESVRAELAKAGVAAELVLVRTEGDRDRESPLRSMGKGIFIKELEDALLAERVDIAVHSMKDVPTELPAGLAIQAVCKRHDVRDALVSRSGLALEHLPSGARVATSSLRRQAQLRHYRRDLEMAEIRGNVDTRLAKVERGDYDAVVLAKAGLDRLGLAGRITQVISVDISLPAAGQGAIGIEGRVRDEEVGRALASLDDDETRIAVDAERAALGALGGGCSVPIGVWARVSGSEVLIDACVLSPDGSETVRAKVSGEAAAAVRLGSEVAGSLLEQGAGRLLKMLEPKTIGNVRGNASGQ